MHGISTIGDYKVQSMTLENIDIVREFTIMFHHSFWTMINSLTNCETMIVQLRNPSLDILWREGLLQQIEKTSQPKIPTIRL